MSQGSLRLFRFAGIDLHLHWSWFLVAYYEISQRAGHYSSLTWNVLEYLGLFLIVVLHEFGHALACRQVGGRADHIVLWPLGGVAYVQPPPRPGATLWSIAAGPHRPSVLSGFAPSAAAPLTSSRRERPARTAAPPSPRCDTASAAVKVPSPSGIPRPNPAPIPA
jgi:Zn-dependent protease